MRRPDRRRRLGRRRFTKRPFRGTIIGGSLPNNNNIVALDPRRCRLRRGGCWGVPTILPKMTT